jgi:hypothetical protein
MREVALESGLVVSARYRLVSCLSRGGMGVVWRATHTALGRDVAVKVLQLDRHSDETVRQFEREARVCARLRHPNNVQVIDFATNSDIGTMLVMELVDGHPLSELPLPLPPRRAVEIGRQVCSAVGEAHALNLVHRDLKPSNVMVIRVDDADFVKVLDYGIATFAHDTSEQGRFTGTPLYASPEQCAGTALDDRTDIYSLGVMLYELIAGQPPFARADRETLLYHHRFSDVRPLRLVADVPAELDDVVMRCLSKDRDHRPASMAVLRAELEAVLAILPAATSRPAADVRRQLADNESAETTMVVATPGSFAPLATDATVRGDRSVTIDRDTVVARVEAFVARGTISAWRAASTATRRVVYADGIALVVLAFAAGGLAYAGRRVETDHATPSPSLVAQSGVATTDAPVADTPSVQPAAQPGELCNGNGVCAGDATVIAAEAPAAIMPPEPALPTAAPPRVSRTGTSARPASASPPRVEPPPQPDPLPDATADVPPADAAREAPSGSAATEHAAPADIDEILGATVLRRDNRGAVERTDHGASVEHVLRRAGDRDAASPQP